MQLLFCHDGPLKIDDEGNYYGIAHNDELFKRYYAIADEIKVAIRISQIPNKNSIKSLSRITVSPFKVCEIPNISRLKGLLFSRYKAKKIIEDAVINSDYIVARIPSTSGFIAIDYAKKYKKPFITELVTCPWDAHWNHSLKGKLVAPFMYFATKKRVKESNYVVYVTNGFLQNRYPTNGKSINCSNVVLSEFNDKTINNRLEKIKKMKKNKKILIGTTAAVNVRFKGQQYIIKALSKLKKQGYKNFEYQLVGAGDQSYLRSVAKKCNVLNQVKFLGPMKHMEVFEWLETIDIYVQPSRQEGLPRALIEAMSKGVPAFGAKTAGIPELLDEGVLFSNTKNNIEEICSVLLNFTKDKMATQAVSNYEESKNYDIRLINERRNKFFKEFVQGE